MIEKSLHSGFSFEIFLSCILWWKVCWAPGNVWEVSWGEAETSGEVAVRGEREPDRLLVTKPRTCEILTNLSTHYFGQCGEKSTHTHPLGVGKLCF